MTQTAQYDTLKVVSSHATVRWRQRSPLPDAADADLRRVWSDAEPVDYPSARDNTSARYHERSGLVLLARNATLVTCIDLADRPRDEQQYVTQQLTDSPQ